MTDLVVLNATHEGVTVALPRDAPARPRTGEVLHFLLDTTSGPSPVAVRADVLEALVDGDVAVLVCAIRATDTRETQTPIASGDHRNRREAFRVSPTAGERIPVSIITDVVRMEGWVVDVSASGMRIATSSKDVQRLRAKKKVHISLTIPGFEAPADTDCVIVHTFHDAKPRLVSVRFSLPSGHSEFERMIVSYVMHRQREIIRRLRGL
jgi:hypothetical protein